MTSAKRVKDSVEIALSEEFLVADKPSDLGVQLQNFALEECFGGLDLTEFDQLISKIMSDHDRYETSMDSAMTVDLHKSLPLSRRQASDRRFWAWLGVVHMPDFVAWRWKPSGELKKRNKDRFNGDRVRQAFARLWWAAELTRDGDDYSLTGKLLAQSGFQDNYEAIFGRAFGNYRPAMEAFIVVTEGEKEKFIRDFSKELGYALTTSVLETMDGNHLQKLLIDLVAEMKKKAA